MGSSSGPGSSSQRGRSAKGRATPKGSPAKASTVGRYVDAETGGRYTRPVPKDVKTSPKWYGPVILALLIVGVLVILLNYLGAFGSPSGWALLGGLVVIGVGFGFATRYR